MIWTSSKRLLSYFINEPCSMCKSAILAIQINTRRSIHLWMLHGEVLGSIQQKQSIDVNIPEEVPFKIFWNNCCKFPKSSTSRISSFLLVVLARIDCTSCKIMESLHNILPSLVTVTEQISDNHNTDQWQLW